MISDRAILDLSSKMMDPFCESYRLIRYDLVTPMEFCDSSAKEIVNRTLICPGAIIASTLICNYPVPIIAGLAFIGLSGKMLRALGFALQSGNFTHVLGQGSEKNLAASLKLMTWNICGLAGGFSLDHGGVLPWKERFDAIVKTIKSEDPDVLVLQEIVDTELAESLIEKLNTEYAHFFIHLGSSVWGVGSGCMVLSKCAIHDFSFTSFSNRDWTLHRGFASLELKKSPEEEKPCIRILGTHLLYGRPSVAHASRMQQVAEMIDSIAKRTFSIPTIIAGDLNIERDHEDGVELNNLLHHGYVGIEPTCTDQFLAKWSQEKALQFPEETVDYISSVRSEPPVIFQDVHIVPAFENDVRTARSDHHALVAEIKITK
ncbi:MAG TPA: endonuclease/exonuclease/phosphatase family protein [Chlamydiales bacterium]|nr:endonuclease/exonuclease/phosphatase family protein [Chlamydiales bacterium]